MERHRPHTAQETGDYWSGAAHCGNRITEMGWHQKAPPKFGTIAYLVVLSAPPHFPFFAGGLGLLGLLGWCRKRMTAYPDPIRGGLASGRTQTG